MNTGKRKRMIVGFILMALILIVTSMIIILKNKTIYNTMEGGENIVTAKQKIEENGWNYEIISNITTDNVPIPDQYSYVSGSKETGVIVDDLNGCYYLWIPYEEDIEIDVSDFFQNIESNYEIDVNVSDSIIKYGGFYVALNMNLQLDDLKSIGNEEYEGLAMQLNTSLKDMTINSHMLYKEELKQIINFMNSDEFDIGCYSVGIKANTIDSFAKVKTYKKFEILDSTEENLEDAQAINDNQESLISKDINNEENENTDTILDEDNSTTEIIEIQDYIYKLKTTEYPEGIPIPSGYRYNESKNGIVSIQDNNNNNLVYIWVPLNIDDLEKQKEELKLLYENYVNNNGEKLKTGEGSEIYKVFNETEEILPEELLDSIKKYGGFYVSEAELGYDSSGNYYNRARGMVESTVTKTVHGGDYYRGSSYEGFTMDKIKEIATNVTEDNYAVVSHLMYGVEYDAMVLWIRNTNSNYRDSNGNCIDTVLLENSTLVGKYSNSNIQATSTADKSSEYLNGIWGLGGNLAEITQETSGSSYVTRGGAYNKTGEESPIASRGITDTISAASIGFRTCLYISTDLPEVMEEQEEFDAIEEDDTIAYIGDFEFNQADWNNERRWVNTWDGLKVYEEPDITSQEINTLGFATEVQVNAKATKAADTKDVDGTNLHWARIKFPNGTQGFINAYKLTDTTTTIGNYKFVIKKEVTRYHPRAIDIYKNPDSTGEIKKKIDYAGALTIIGKSTNAEWAIVEIDGQQGYVYANKLAVTAKVETINGIKFIVGDSEIRFVKNEEGATGYKNPYYADTGAAVDSEAALVTIPYKSVITLNAISEDEKIGRVVYKGNTYFVSMDDLQYPGPTLVVDINNNTGKVTVKAYDIGKGVKDIYSNTDILDKQEKKDEDGNIYYEATFTAKRSEKYYIKAVDKEGNWTHEGYIDTSNIKKDESSTPIQTTPTTIVYNPKEDNNGKSDGKSESEKPQIIKAYSTNDVIVVYSSDDTQYICYKKTTDSKWSWYHKTEVTTIYVGDETGTYDIVACKYVNSKPVYSECKSVTVDGEKYDPSETTKPVVYCTLSNNQWTNKNVYIYIYVKSTSGISSILVNGNNAIYQWSESKKMYVGIYEATRYGQYTIKVTGRNKETTTVKTTTVRIDKEKPYFSGGAQTYNGYYSAYYKDNLSGVASCKICDKKDKNAYSGKDYIVFAKKGIKHTVLIKDYAGNSITYTFTTNW